MDANTRAKVVAAISAGWSNREVSGEFGVTVNQVAGVRCRDFDATMTREAALQLGSQRWREQGRETADRVLCAIPAETAIRRRALLNGSLSKAQLDVILRKLVARGAVVREASGLYRRVSA